MTTFYIVRHGESEGNANYEVGKSTNRTELGTKLTELGVKQVEKLASELKHLKVDAIYSSDFNRAKQTADILALEKGITVLATQALRERRYGEAGENITREMKAKFNELFHTLSLEEQMKFKMTPDQESAGETVERFVTFLRELAIAYAGKTILIVCHGFVMRSFLVHIGYASFNELGSGTVANAAYIVVESDGVEFMLKETNGVHKRTEGREE